MRHDVNGYLDGYMEKTALTPEGFASLFFPASYGGYKVTSDVMSRVFPWLLLAPFVVGAGAGTMHAKLESPTKMDASAVQKSLRLAELDEFAAELARRRAAARLETIQKEKSKEDPGERTLHV